MEKRTVVNELGLYAKILGSLVAICTGGWFLFGAAIDRYVEAKVEAYNESPAFEARHRELTKAYVESPDFHVYYVEVISQRGNHKLSLRELLAPKMEVPVDEVHVRLGDLVKDEERVKEMLVILDQRLQEIEQYY